MLGILLADLHNGFPNPDASVLFELCVLQGNLHRLSGGYVCLGFWVGGGYDGVAVGEGRGVY